MIDRIIIGENRKVGRKSSGPRQNPGGAVCFCLCGRCGPRNCGMRAFMCPGEVVGFIHPDDTYRREIVRLLSGEPRWNQEARGWLAVRWSWQVEERTWSDTVLDILRITRRVFFPKLDVAENLTIAGLNTLLPE